VWAIPNHFKCDVKDQDQRLKLISENFITNRDKEYQPPTLHPISVWKNKEHTWQEIINVADSSISEHLQTISKRGLSFKHETQDVIEDKYEDLPFFSQSTLKGNYVHMGMDIWNQQIKLETIPKPKGNLWPTTLASDSHYYLMNIPKKESTWGTEEQRNKSSLPTTLYWLSQLYKTHEVNPRWFEQMMGLPVGWTDAYFLSLT
jgi:hypothetical protein